MKRDLFVYKKKSIHDKRSTRKTSMCLIQTFFARHEEKSMEKDLFIYEKRRMYLWKEIYKTEECTCLSRSSPEMRETHEKRPVKGGLCIYEKRHMHVWKETYVSMKRDISNRRACIRCSRSSPEMRETHEKRTMYICKETYVWRDLCIYQKRPTYLWKETHVTDTHVPDARAPCPRWEKHMKKDPYIHKKKTCVLLKRNLCTHEKRPT